MKRTNKKVYKSLLKRNIRSYGVTPSQKYVSRPSAKESDLHPNVMRGACIFSPSLPNSILNW